MKPSWLEDAKIHADLVANRVGVRLGHPFEGSNVSLVFPGRREDGSNVVIKVQWPHRESEHEAAALERWDGNGAIRLLEHDPQRHTLVLERCHPGEPLSSDETADALGVLIELLPRLWIPAAEPFRTLDEEAEGWAESMPLQWDEAGRPFGEDLLEAALNALRELSSSQGEQVLVNQDLHGDNVLSAQREPWLVIDPKPLIGEREFGLAPIIRSSELGHSRDHVVGRLDRLSEELALDRTRVAGWAGAHTLAWAFEDRDVLPGHVEEAGWLLAEL